MKYCRTCNRTYEDTAAFCRNCGTALEVYPQTQNNQTTYQQPQYNQTAYQQPQNSQTTYQQPQNSQTTYQQPQYNQPTYQQPQYNQTTYQQYQNNQTNYQYNQTSQQQYQNQQKPKAGSVFFEKWGGTIMAIVSLLICWYLSALLGIALAAASLKIGFSSFNKVNKVLSLIVGIISIALGIWAMI